MFLKSLIYVPGKRNAFHYFDIHMAYGCTETDVIIIIIIIIKLNQFLALFLFTVITFTTQHEVWLSFTEQLDVSNKFSPNRTQHRLTYCS